MAWKLAASRRVLVAAPDYLRLHGAPRSPQELEGHRGIFYMHRGGADWRFSAQGRVHVVHGRPGLVLNNGDMMRAAAIAGLGVALLPLFIISAALADGRLCAIDVGIEAEQEYVYIDHADGQHPSAKLRALAAWLKQAFGSPPLLGCRMRAPGSGPATGPAAVSRRRPSMASKAGSQSAASSRRREGHGLHAAASRPAHGARDAHADGGLALRGRRRARAPAPRMRRPASVAAAT